MPKPYGQRLLPAVLDSLASSSPQRIYASQPRDGDLANGFQDVSCADMSRCADYMAHWIEKQFGRSESCETLCYIGIPDLRSVPVFFGAVKCGYKTECSKVLHAKEVMPIIRQLQDTAEAQIQVFPVPAFSKMLNSEHTPFAYSDKFPDVKDKPIVVLHSSGSTGISKPITMTHSTFAVLDNERNLPSVPGRKNRDYSIWDFEGHGKFYTVFPYFHLAGCLSLIINPVFTEASSPVIGPPLMPPSGALMKDVMKHQKLRALYIPPSIAEQLLQEPDGLDFFKDLDFLCYTGGPFSYHAGERLSKVTELCPLYGSTEAFQVPQLAPAPSDWAWMEWNPHFKFQMEPAEDDAYELVLFADASTANMSALNHNLLGTAVFRTKDLFKRHPEKDNLWRYHARRDDIIVLSNGEKFNPVPFELFVQGHKTLTGALVVGNGRSQGALILEARPEVKEDQRESLMNDLWSHVEQANELVPAQGRIVRSNIFIAPSEKPFMRAGKGTIIRKLTEQNFKTEIEALYAPLVDNALTTIDVSNDSSSLFRNA